MRDNPTTATEALKELAAIRLKDAEEGCHKLFRKYSLTVPVKIEKLNVGTGELQRCPVVVLSTWVNYLLDQDKLSFLTGFESESKNFAFIKWSCTCKSIGPAIAHYTPDMKFLVWQSEMSFSLGGAYQFTATSMKDGHTSPRHCSSFPCMEPWVEEREATTKEWACANCI